MDLRGAAPEILGKFLLAHEKACSRKRRAGGEGQRESDIDFASIRPPRLAGEIESGKIAQTFGGEDFAIGLGVDGAHRQHRQSLALRQKAADKAGERIDAGLGRRRCKPLPQSNQFEECAVELDDVILGSPGMAIARANLKSKPAVQRCLRIQIMRSDDEVVDGAGQRPSRRLLQLHDIV
jgi:hypothetical protein